MFCRVNSGIIRWWILVISIKRWFEYHLLWSNQADFLFISPLKGTFYKPFLINLLFLFKTIFRKNKRNPILVKLNKYIAVLLPVSSRFLTKQETGRRRSFVHGSEEEKTFYVNGIGFLLQSKFWKTIWFVTSYFVCFPSALLHVNTELLFFSVYSWSCYHCFLFCIAEE